MKFILTLFLMSLTYLSASSLDCTNTETNIAKSICSDEKLLFSYNKMILLTKKVYKKVDTSNLPTMHMETYIWNNHVNEQCKTAKVQCLEEEITERTEKLSVILKDNNW